MEAREKLTKLGCDKHSYLGDGVYCGTNSEGQIWLIKNWHGDWHVIALGASTLLALYRYTQDKS